jgi:hypothetical protein
MKQNREHRNQSMDISLTDLQQRFHEYTVQKRSGGEPNIYMLKNGIILLTIATKIN